MPMLSKFDKSLARCPRRQDYLDESWEIHSLARIDRIAPGQFDIVFVRAEASGSGGRIGCDVVFSVSEPFLEAGDLDEVIHNRVWVNLQNEIELLLAGANS